MAKAYKGRNANYNFRNQVDPDHPMGEGDFANMPADPKYLSFDNRPRYRDGNVNSFTANVESVSDIYENRRKP